MNREQVEKLRESGHYNGNVVGGEIIETHISWVLISEELVFKMKKPMKYSFLDFSTIEKRKYYCERELLLNQRLCDIYLSVLPVVEYEGKVYLGPGKGLVIDHAVCMKRMDASLKMDILIRDERIRENHILKLASKISGFHQVSEIIHKRIPLERYKSDFNDLACAQEWIHKHLDNKYNGLIEELLEFSDRFLADNYSHMMERMNDGFYRDVHGDLHSKNIFIYDDPVIFDCIEFNDNFRQIDLLNELAFFCMDLESMKRQDLSALFMKKYNEILLCVRNEQDRALFIYYKLYRSNVRAKVNVLRAMQASNDELVVVKSEIIKYLELCREYINE